MSIRFTTSVALLLPLLLQACGGASDPASMTNAGVEKLNSGSYAEALVDFDKALEGMEASDPQYLRAKMGAIEALIYLDGEKAKTDFLALAEAGKADEKDFRTIGGKMTSAGKYKEAVEVLDAAVQKYGKKDTLVNLIIEVQKYAKEKGDAGALEALSGLGYL